MVQDDAEAKIIFLRQALYHADLVTQAILERTGPAFCIK